MLAAVLGCAGSHRQKPVQHQLGPSTNASATQPVDQNAFLPLEKIEPFPQLGLPATQPADREPLEALELYGKARDAMLQGERYTAITLLEKAAALDQHSFQLFYDLGKAYLSIANMDEKGIAALEKAATLEPDHLDLQVQIGRYLLSKGQTESAIQHLRLALQTSDYPLDDGRAAVADFFLARALQQGGYDRAALDRYDLLLQRMKNPTMQIRENPELGYLIDRPELLFVEIGQLYEKHGAYAEALEAYEPAARADPDNFEAQARVARMLGSLGRRDEALNKAADVVVHDRASAESLALLADVCHRLSLPDGVIGGLTQLHKTHPDDRAVLFALSDALIAANRSGDAIHLLGSAWESEAGDTQLTRRLVSLERSAGQVEAAARTIVIALSKNPDSLRNLSPLWDQLLWPSQKNRLKLMTVEALNIPAGAEASRQFWISRLAEIDRRDALVRSALEKSSQYTPPFAPAYRELMNVIWSQQELSTQQKVDAAAQLSSRAAAEGDSALGAEIAGLSLLNQKQMSAAAEKFEQAVHEGGSSPDLQLEKALAEKKPGRDGGYEQNLWKLISDHPLFDDGYSVLFRYYVDSDVGELNQAVKVLSTWLTSDPLSVAARVLEATVDAQLGSPAEAETKIAKLFDDNADDGVVLSGMQSIYGQAGQLSEFINKLQGYCTAHRQDTDVAARLVAVLIEQKQPDEARKVVDAAHQAVAGDAELLYSVAQMYTMLDAKSEAEQSLQQVLKIDPSHVGANNDLGFEWADEGKNLGQAESLIRIAVAAEPENQSFLDSLGWVLYKQGKFEQAKKYLEQAIGSDAFPDPVVLDHLGDTLYRLTDRRAAVIWKQSLDGIGDGDPAREDLRQLRGTLQQKLKQASATQPVDVAPVNK